MKQTTPPSRVLGSLAEVFHQGVPVIVVRPAAALARDPERLARLRANVRALPPNRAVWEALDVIEKSALGGSPGPRPA